MNIKFHYYYLSRLFYLSVLSVIINISAENIITVNCGKEIRNLDDFITGDNLMGFDFADKDPGREHSYGNTDYGTGIWDPVLKQSVKTVISLAKNAGVSALRFPGGCGSHNYDWKRTIGGNRQHYLFGLDEFLQVCKEVDAEPIITLSYFTGTPEDAGDMVEYLNSPADAAHPLALKRSENGHPQPYKVKYFEVGNEVFHGNHRDIKKVKPVEYAKQFLKFYEELKRRDSSVQIGVVLDIPWWNQKVAEVIKDKVDFGIIHSYPTPVWGKTLESVPPKEIFEVSFAIAMIRDDFIFKDTLNLFNEVAGKKLPLAVTEFNGGYAQEKPVPYRFSLGCALVNAELMNVFMKPENHIFMVNHWQFINTYTGAISNGFQGNRQDLYKPYYKRPNYFVFEMYKNHFGSVLLDTSVDCDSYDISQYAFYKKIVEANLKEIVLDKQLISAIKGKIPYLSVSASKSEDGKKIYLMVLNKNLKEVVSSTIQLKDFIPASSAKVWTLNGPEVVSTNELNHDNVRITSKTFQIYGADFEFTFEAHSLTAIEISGKGD